MCEAMRILMKEEIKDEITKAQKTGETRGEMKAKQETAFELAGMGLSIEKIAQAVKVNIETVRSWFSEMPNVAR